MTEKFDFLNKELNDRTDREIEISKVLLQRQTNKHLKSISNNVQFFFWLTIVSIAITVLAYIISES